MRLFSGKIAPLSEEIVKVLLENQHIETEAKREVVRDVESVFESYLQLDREATEKAKDLLQSRGMPPTEFYSGHWNHCSSRR